MAITNRSSAAITNRDASPRVINNPTFNQTLRETVGYIAAAADDAGTSVYRICTVPSNARISQILLTCADFSTAGAIDVGLHNTTVNGGAAVDANLFATAVDLSGGPFANLDVTREAATTNWTLADAENMVWESLGLSADPGVEYDITATISTTFNGGSGLLFKVRYVE